MAGLHEKLNSLKESGRLAMHMPGHKRNPDFLCGLPVDIDITEIEGFDDLGDMQGVLKEIAQKAAELYGAKRAYLLVNGSTCGILACVSAVSGKGKNTLVMGRNCHKSVYNAAMINRLNTKYIMPEADELGVFKPITVREVLSAVDEDTCAVVITSPTYEGVVSDIRGIKQALSPLNIPLIVDSAHGAHFGFDERLPENAAAVADYTVVSLHKTLPALTGCALLLANDVDYERLYRTVCMYQTTSPSYVLMAAIEDCLGVLASKKPLFDALFCSLDKLCNELAGLKNIRLKTYGDKTRLLLTGANGYEIMNALRVNGVEAEMALPGYCVLITTVCDKEQAFDVLAKAIKKADNMVKPQQASTACLNIPPVALPLFNAYSEQCERVSVEAAINRVCAQYVYAYPPGIPLITPGEVLTPELAELVLCGGYELKGVEGGKITVLK